jgi:hypothetical protein
MQKAVSLSSPKPGAEGDGQIVKSIALLHDERLRTVQRQELATQIGQVKGNCHLQQIVVPDSKAFAPTIHLLRTGVRRSVMYQPAINLPQYIRLVEALERAFPEYSPRRRAGL